MYYEKVGKVKKRKIIIVKILIFWSGEKYNQLFKYFDKVAFYHKMETRWIWPDSQLFLNYQVAEENIGRSLKNKLIIMTAEIQFFFMSLNETGAAIRTRMWTSSRSFGLPHLLRRRFSMQSSVGSGVKPQQYLSSRSWTFASEERQKFSYLCDGRSSSSRRNLLKDGTNNHHLFWF